MRDGASRFAGSASGAARDCADASTRVVRGRAHWLLALLALVTPLFLAPSAHAERGVIGHFEFGRPIDFISNFKQLGEPTFFINAEGLAVNSTGAGAASPGDIYVNDRGTRIQQFSASNAFERMWGNDVVESGPGEQDEIQAIRVLASGGTYSLTFEGDTSNPIPYDASAGTVQAALNALPSIGAAGSSVTAVGGPGDTGGTSPYVIRFGGSLADTDQPLISSEGSSLSGGAETVWISTVRQQGSLGSEVCEPENGDECKGALGGPLFSGSSMAVDQATGDVYLTGFPRIQKYSASGEILRTFGYDVVALGPGDTGLDEVQQLEIEAAAGTFRLGVQSSLTDPIPYDATASEVEAALSGLPGISEAYEEVSNVAGSVSVSGGPGDATGSSPYVVTYGGALGGDNVDQFTVNGVNLTGSATVTTTVEGGGAEVCVPATGDQCAGGFKNAGAPGGVVFFGDHNGLDVIPPGLPNAGNVLVGGGQRVSEFTPAGAFVRAFGWDVDADDPGTGFEICTAASGDLCQAGASGSGVGQFEGGPQAIAVDAAGAIYTLDSAFGKSRVQKFTPQAGPPALEPSLFGAVGAPNGTSSADAAIGLALGSGGEVFVAKRYPAGSAICPDGSSSPAEVRIQELTPAAVLVETSRPCTVDPDSSLFPAEQVIAGVPFNGLKVDTGTDRPLMLNEPDGFANTPPRVYVYGDPGSDPQLTLNAPSNVGPTAATISGTIDSNGPEDLGQPHPPDTVYRVEYREVGSPTWEPYSTDTPIGHGTSPVPFSVGISGLTPKHEYEARVILTKPFGFAQAIQVSSSFTTLAAPPRIVTFTSSNVTAHSVDLEAQINPLGTETTYHFEYGLTPGYGQSTPEVGIGDSLTTIPVAAHVEGLEGNVYHFRVVATNSVGVTTTTDQTFSFYPERCPNNIARQQTGSGSLPDCRAYELVSPGNAGSISLIPIGANSPYADNPARLSYAGQFGKIAGPWNPPNIFGDHYLSTRTAAGWRTTYVGLAGDEYATYAGPPGTTTAPAGIRTDQSMSRFALWDHGSDAFGSTGSFAGFMFGAGGEQLGRLPTNVGEVPGAYGNVATDDAFAGDVELSPDFGHYFFSSDNTAFAAGGLTSPPGSAYDNDLASGAVTVISRLPNGDDIPPTPEGPDEFLTLPDSSASGSHILIGAPGLCGPRTSQWIPCNGPSVLYMRVNGTVTYEVSRGAIVNYAGMSSEGSRVFFTTSADLTEDGTDTDSSVDLYAWSEQGDHVTRLSVGAGAIGNSDACNSAWISKCGVEVVRSDDSYAKQAGQKHSYDSPIASENGDIYFYAPEQLLPPQGIPGRRNLYVAHNGLLDYVATLDSDKPLSRIEVTPDGSYAAFVTTNRLTNYDNAAVGGVCMNAASGQPLPTGSRCQQMYGFTRATGAVECLSCDPHGTPPTDDVDGSQNGRFLADDGRAFFSTEDPLVPADSNGINDVYEFVAGRPQLISSGVAAIDRTVGAQAALVGVTADGVNAYFGVTEALVAGDDNGQVLRFYDARTGGGFPVSPAVLPCAAADECHGPTVGPPPAAGTASGANLGPGGNLPAGPCKSLSRRARRLSEEARRHQGSARARLRRQAEKLRAKAKRCRGGSRAKDRGRKKR